MYTKFLGLALLASIALTSCDPSDVVPDTEDPTPTPENNNTQTPSFASGDGAIVALNTRTVTSTPIGNTTIDLGTAVAVFGDLAAGTYNDAGSVTLNGKSLTKTSNNAYSYVPSATDFTGIDFEDNIKWEVSSPSFTYDAKTQGRGMPVADGDFTFSGSSVSGSTAFTLELSGSISNADSVYFQINGPNNYVLKRMGGQATSVTFSASEMQSLGTSAGCSVTIAPWNHESKNLGGKTIHVVNELAINKVIEIN